MNETDFTIEELRDLSMIVSDKLQCTRFDSPKFRLRSKIKDKINAKIEAIYKEVEHEENSMGKIKDIENPI